MRPLPSRARVMELLEYEPDTGLFRWRCSRGHGAARVVRGAVAGTPIKGHLAVGIDGGRYYLHRLAFLVMTGEWPSEDVDHISGVKHDNRWANLRAASRSQNNENQRRAHKQSSHGYLGVVRANRPAGVLWMARIQVGGSVKHLGCFAGPKEAHEAYLQAKARLHEFAPPELVSIGDEFLRPIRGADEPDQTRTDEDVPVDKPVGAPA